MCLTCEPGFYYISSNEYCVEPFGAHLVTKFESNAVEKVSSSLPHQPMDVNLPMNVDLPPHEGNRVYLLI